MARLSIELLGSPRVTVDDEPISVDTRKAIALLAYLAVTGQAHSRDTLATLLWPEYDQQSARASLRRTLSALKKGLGRVGDVLHVQREHIGLSHAHDNSILLDVERFKSLLTGTETHGHASTDVCPACLTPLSEAAALYRGDFLVGFVLRDCPEFEDWQRYESESLKRTLAGGLERLATALASAGKHEEAVAAAHRRVTLDPLHEPAHRQLMLVYAWAGQRAAALQHYRVCVRTLEEELAVAPLPETTQLAELIRENRTPPPPGFVQLVPGAFKHRPNQELPRVRASGHPLVGRAREWDLLQTAYARAMDTGCLIVLEGEAGIGKTRLAESFVSDIRARGARVVSGRCYEGESGLAYAVIAEGLRVALMNPNACEQLQSVPDNWLSEAARLVPELALGRPELPPPVSDPISAGARLVEGLRRVLVALLQGSAPGVLFLDDLQWADEASLDLVSHMLRRLRQFPVVVLATWRDEEWPATIRLQQLVADARRSGAATTVILPRLGSSDVAELLKAIDPPLDQDRDLASRLYAHTEGLPVFLIAYLEALAEGTQALDALPGGVRDLLRARVAGASETARQLLGTAAIIGHSFDFDTLRDASGRSEEETAIGLDELVARRLVREVDTGVVSSGALRFDFAHEQLRQVVYHDTSLVRRRLLHRRVAEALRNGPRGRRATDPDPGQIGQHYHLAGQDDLAADYFCRAGEYAQDLHANSEALAHFRTALALGYPDTTRLHESMGDLLTLSGAYDAAATSYDFVAARGPRARLAVIERKLGSLFVRQGAWDLAESHFQAAVLEASDTDVTERARLLAAWSLAAHRQGQLDRAWTLATEALETATAADDARALAECHNIAGMLARHRGDLVQAARHLELSLALATAKADPSARIAALNNLALLCAATAQPERGLELLDAALGLCRLLGDHHQEAALLTNTGDLLRATGHTDEAIARVKQAVAILADIGAESGNPQPEIWKLTEW